MRQDETNSLRSERNDIARSSLATSTALLYVSDRESWRDAVAVFKALRKLGWGAAQENPPDGRSLRPRSPEKQIPLGRSDSNYRAAAARALKKRAHGRSSWWPKAGENDRDVTPNP